jgi:hypothetical protein
MARSTVTAAPGTSPTFTSGRPEAAAVGDEAKVAGGRGYLFGGRVEPSAPLRN